MKKAYNISYFVFALGVFIYLLIPVSKPDSLSLFIVILLLFVTSVFTYSNRRKR
ncbi:hypothetical protein [Candidatus Izimaplasma sp. ZiA1]|uniref:hypothetical protein n=1 Tax=Candidatus Izimoplasma sp. ZiA1 TaxID=2024899 RepID=UPI00143A075B